MKIIVIGISTLVATALFFSSINFFNAQERKPEKKLSTLVNPVSRIENGFALVELFTSEGCSSCPPADELVNEISKAKKENVFILSWHVDYWNKLGWKDPFSNAKWSSRQHDYATALNLDGVYTPQIVVNGREEFVGANRSRLVNSIEKNLLIKNKASIQIDASFANNKISVINKVNDAVDAVLQIALVQLNGSSQVKNGENGGRFLQHKNIVRDLKTVGPNEKEIQFNIPASGFVKDDFKIIAFLQSKSMGVIAANECSIK